MFKLAISKVIDSTQLRLVEAVKNGFNEDNFALASFSQTSGIGSNNRIWVDDSKIDLNSMNTFKKESFKDLDFVFYDDYTKYDFDIKSNLFLSFYTSNMPSDLPMQSVSIYYAMILKLALMELNSKAFVKWPNDIYLNNKKIGGVISSKIKNKIICGIGLNIISSPNEADILDIKINLQILFKAFFGKVLLKPLWKDIYECYKNDFALSESFYFKHGDDVFSLSNAKLYSDGSILIDNKRIYSLR